MSIEEQIREKQSFEHNLKLFLKLASGLSDNEIEIVLGRLADKIANSENDSHGKHVQFTGDILKLYYDLRISGAKKQSKARRIGLINKYGISPDSSFKERLISELANSILTPPKFNFQDHYKSESQFVDTIKLLAP